MGINLHIRNKDGIRWHMYRIQATISTTLMGKETLVIRCSTTLGITGLVCRDNTEDRHQAINSRRGTNSVRSHISTTPIKILN